MSFHNNNRVVCLLVEQFMLWSVVETSEFGGFSGVGQICADPVRPESEEAVCFIVMN